MASRGLSPASLLVLTTLLLLGRLGLLLMNRLLLDRFGLLLVCGLLRLFCGLSLLLVNRLLLGWLGLLRFLGRFSLLLLLLGLLLLLVFLRVCGSNGSGEQEQHCCSQEFSYIHGVASIQFQYKQGKSKSAAEGLSNVEDEEIRSTSFGHR